MEMWTFLAGGAALGILASCWSTIKNVAWRCANLFICQVEIPSEPGHNSLIAYLIARYKHSRNYDRMYGAHYEYQRDGRYGLIPYELFGNRSMVFWNGWFPFIYTNAIERKAAQGSNNKGNNNSGSGDEEVTKVYSTITFLRGTLDVEEMVRQACSETNHQTWSANSSDEQLRNRFVIHFIPRRGNEGSDWGSRSNGLAWYQQGHYRLLMHSPDQLGKGHQHKGGALTNLIFPQRIKDLIKEIELWRNNRNWYFEKGIPWKRGWLLYGPPGTGKTALARAFAEDLNMPIYVFNLAEMGNHELMKAWTEMQVNVPCIALIEDIDNVFHGRENITRKNGMLSMLFGRKKENNNNNEEDRQSLTPLTFDCLLNCLDGVERADGIFTIITTNDISKIDPALGQPRRLPDGSTEFISTRPGRIDKAVELSYMEAADKKLMAKRILGEYPEPYEAVLDFIDRFPELQETPAQFQERCGQIALACFWKEQQDLKLIESKLQGPMAKPEVPSQPQPVPGDEDDPDHDRNGFLVGVG